MAHNCLICKGGHHAKYCLEKHSCGSESSKICLKCGSSGHDMFTCKNDYLLGDLKEIQCYICKRFGHLCCVYSDDAMPRETSCYKCGQLGHTGSACSSLHGEATGAMTPSSYYNCDEEGYFAWDFTSSAKATRSATCSCYKCGEEGHFSWECTYSAKDQLMRASSRLHGEAPSAAVPISCFKCGKEGHLSWECKSSAKDHGEATGLLSCFKCGKRGHFAWECPSFAR